MSVSIHLTVLAIVLFLVDWATLAQQWIKMKETFPVDQVPPAPPPPSIKDDIEAGEAPMDMSKDDVVPQAPQGEYIYNPAMCQFDMYSKMPF